MKKYYLSLSIIILLLFIGLYKIGHNKKFDINIFKTSTKHNPNKIFVFDFDLTLTLKDTGDIILKNGYSLKEVFGKHLKSLKDLFKKINNKTHLIFINTANSKHKVKKILNKAQLIKYIKEIYGASSLEEISNPIEHSNLWEKKKNMTIEHKWALTKKYYLNKIKSQYSKSTIYFFDDLDINIEKSKECIKNCYMVKKGNIPELINQVNACLD
ncbi:MAG: hypothetical protein GY823_13510 [Flavobacteriaceae bacterium]|nr:hypothetical protein [Flavobacteriaceae bacterium]